MSKTFIKIFSILGLAIAFTGCIRKDDYFSYDQSSPNRKQVVKIANGADIVVIARDVTPTIDTFGVIDLRREPNSAAELNQPLTVKLVKNPSLIDDYNTANGTFFVELPATSYTILEDLNNITFQPGEDIKQIKIRLNKTGLDLSQQYALAFSISDAGSGAVINSSLKNGLYAIGVKNKWDGVYTVTGSFRDATNAAFTGLYPYEWELQTSGATQCTVVDNIYLGFPGFAFNTGTGLSYYGSFGLVVNFDPATNKILSVTNAYGQNSGGNQRSAALDPSGANSYDAATKTISIKYYMIQNANLNPPQPNNIRCFFNETWTFDRPR